MEATMQQVFRGIEQKDIELWGNHIVKLKHTLHEQDLFSDESVARLIETISPERMTITTMAATGHDLRTWRHGVRGSQSGNDVLEAVKRGRIWINMMNIHEIDPRFSDVLGSMYEELHRTMPGFSSSKQTLGLLISSPNAQVFYHADVPGQGLWQIRGRKRIWIYPNSEPFLKANEIENVVRGLQEEDISYQPWYDDYAVTYDLEAGDMLHWPLNGPHRVKNYDCVNISLTTEHLTPQIRRHYAMNYGNGVLRSLGWTPRSRKSDGIAFLPKAALALAWHKAGMDKRQTFRRNIEFQVDPAAPDGVSPLPAA
jgi:hypothetical protein